jgi:putative hydrolase of the HAD superfamily
MTGWRSAKRIVVFDLDDTLYPEIEYVRSGFRAVAFELEARFDVHAEEAFALLWRALQVHGRGKTFDRVLEDATAATSPGSSSPPRAERCWGA